MFKVQLAEELAQGFLLIGYFRDQDDYITEQEQKKHVRVRSESYNPTRISVARLTCERRVSVSFTALESEMLN
jgi:hypothetical protein